MAFLLPSYVYNIHQDTKSPRLIAVCKRTLTSSIIAYTSLFFFYSVLDIGASMPVKTGDDYFFQITRLFVFFSSQNAIKYSTQHTVYEPQHDVELQKKYIAKKIVKPHLVRYNFPLQLSS